MDTPVKHYKFVNSKTDNVIYYYSVSTDLSEEQIKQKLEAVKSRVAVDNGVYAGTVYWEEVKEDK
jgi:hypothetical protein